MTPIIKDVEPVVIKSTKLIDPAKELKVALEEKWKDKPDKELKPSEVTQKEKEQKAVKDARVAAWKAPKEGDTNPKTGNKYTKATATKAKNEMRAARELKWRGEA